MAGIVEINTNPCQTLLEINHVRKLHKIHIWGTDIPDPCESFNDLARICNLNKKLLTNIDQLGYIYPTPIQMQAIPIMSKRREVLVSAPTGSGKTATFVMPIMDMLAKQDSKQGIKAVILEPTRELARQTYMEFHRIGKGLGLKIHLMNKVKREMNLLTRNAASSFAFINDKYVDMQRAASELIAYKVTRDIQPPHCSSLRAATQNPKNRREVLVSAPTGSGKTATFVMPIMDMLAKQDSKQGIKAVILEPTRELARQTYMEFHRIGKGLGLKIHLMNKVKREMNLLTRNAASSFDIIVTTPNRLVYLLQPKKNGQRTLSGGADKEGDSAIDLSNCQWLVVDESDRLFEATGKGCFRDQLAVIYTECSKSSQLRRAFFSATFSGEVEQWCKMNLDNMIMVSIGARNSAVETIKQELLFTGTEHGKIVLLRNLISQGRLKAPVLIFVQSKDRVKQLVTELVYDNIQVDMISGERTDKERDVVIKKFRDGEIWVLVCTELMGRGMDFKGVNLVINFDFPPSAISYIHRIGRSGRAGRSGEAITFFTEKDKSLLRSIANVMQNAGCPVPDYMLQIHKPTKRTKRKLAAKAPSRAPIVNPRKLKKAVIKD